MKAKIVTFIILLSSSFIASLITQRDDLIDKLFTGLIMWISFFIGTEWSKKNNE